MFSPGDAEQLLADAVGDLEVVGQLSVGQLALIESVDLLRKLGVALRSFHSFLVQHLCNNMGKYESI